MFTPWQADQTAIFAKRKLRLSALDDFPVSNELSRPFFVPIPVINPNQVVEHALDNPEIGRLLQKTRVEMITHPAHDIGALLWGNHLPSVKGVDIDGRFRGFVLENKMAGHADSPKWKIQPPSNQYVNGRQRYGHPLPAGEHPVEIAILGIVVLFSAAFETQ